MAWIYNSLEREPAFSEINKWNGIGTGMTRSDMWKKTQQRKSQVLTFEIGLHAYHEDQRLLLQLRLVKLKRNPGHGI
jgi:hypothetical protein